MSANGDTVKVHFRNDFDTKGQLGNSSHDYQTKLRQGDSLHSIAYAEYGDPRVQHFCSTRHAADQLAEEAAKGRR